MGPDAAVVRAQGMRQGGDVGTQYRSAIHALNVGQLEIARASKVACRRALVAADHRDRSRRKSGLATVASAAG